MRRLLPFCLLALAACGGGPDTVTLYCYETLADSACYLEPEVGRGNRLLAVVDVTVTPEIALLLGDEE
jgi:uncharacterized lipoprotein YmbA